ncbi:MAG: helix-turn-helix transcriptional regulator [Phocaeicola plebeius]|jgi:transcriptional regulator with XRE-family HTH domain|uniref:helix-turn-helix domain-containing protein n=1 Tax=Phocaeicola plebeius TaxID=310297 RepID=UPI00241CB554|nr:helix-turn-helix transcriptional regulator [Phocaeicola plebeius]MBS5541082.1 helix-turn-helix transcriptional regulator [Phocaeicola plebeius]
MMKLRLIIGQQIAMLRKKHGLTIRELSELSGINSSNISKIENGKYNISIDIIERICKSLGANVKIDIMHTLEELRDFINSNEDWELTTNKIIELNGWTDETGDNYGICNDGNRRLYLTVSNGVLVADIKDMQHE